MSSFHSRLSNGFLREPKCRAKVSCSGAEQRGTDFGTDFDRAKTPLNTEEEEEEQPKINNNNNTVPLFH